jgi:hypothetical protein
VDVRLEAEEKRRELRSRTREANKRLQTSRLHCVKVVQPFNRRRLPHHPISFFKAMAQSLIIISSLEKDESEGEGRRETAELGKKGSRRRREGEK